MDNLRTISKVLNVSIYFLLDDEENLDKTVIKEQINLDDYEKEGKLRNKKDAVVCSKYSDAIITPLLAKKKSTKGQKDRRTEGVWRVAWLVYRCTFRNR